MTLCAEVSAATPDTRSGTRRGLSLSQGAALYVAAVLGPGVLVIPAAAVAAAGTGAVLVVAGLLLLSAPIAFAFAKLGATRPETGGITALTAAAFGRSAAVATTWLFYLGVPIGIPALALFGAGYLEAVIGGGRLGTMVIAAAIVAVCLVVNWFGVTASGRTQIILCVVLVAGVAAVMVIASPAADADKLSDVSPHGISGLAAAAVLLVWSLTGWEAGTYLAADFARPHRDITRATVIALAVVSAVYLGVTVMFAAVLGAHTALGPAPMAQLLLTRVDAGAAAAVVAALAVVVTVGGTNTYLASLARLGTDGARAGHLPAWLSAAGPSTSTRRALLAVGAYSVGLLAGWWLFDWSATTLAEVCAAVQIAVYLFGLAAAHRLLPAGTALRRGVVAAWLVMAALLVACGVHLIVPALIAAAAFYYSGLRSRENPSTTKNIITKGIAS